MSKRSARNPSPRCRDRNGIDRCVIGWEYVDIVIDDCTRLANVIYRRLRAWAETAPAMNPT
jgi:hypothetical protein